MKNNKKINLNKMLVSIGVLFTIIKPVTALGEDYHEVYFGAGSGLNITQNYGLVKTFYVPSATSNSQYDIQSQFLGNVSGYSMPVYANFGYRFNNYVAAEFDYVYSGNQIYQRPSMSPNKTNFWGSQNNFGLVAVGYIPVRENIFLKGKLGLAYSMDTMTTYAGDPGTKNITSEIGLGAQWFIKRNWSLDFDYINYGLLIPIHENYRAPQSGGPNLGTINTIISNEFLLSINYHVPQL